MRISKKHGFRRLNSDNEKYHHQFSPVVYSSLLFMSGSLHIQEQVKVRVHTQSQSQCSLAGMKIRLRRQPSGFSFNKTCDAFRNLQL